MSFPLRVSNEGLLPVLTRPPSRRGDAAFPNRPAFNDTNDPSKLARFTFLAGGPIGLPLRASNEGYLLTHIQQGSWCGLYCAHRATTALSWGLCEHRDHASRLAINPPFLPRPNL